MKHNHLNQVLGCHQPCQGFHTVRCSACHTTMVKLVHTHKHALKC